MYHQGKLSGQMSFSSEKGPKTFGLHNKQELP